VRSPTSRPTALETTIDKFGPKPPTPPRRRPLSSRTRPRRGRANSTSHDRPLTANAPFPVHHPPTARRTLPHLRPRGHLRAPYEPVHADPLSARTPTASTPTPHASLRHQLTANGHDRHAPPLPTILARYAHDAAELAGPCGLYFRNLRAGLYFRNLRALRRSRCGDRRDLTEIYQDLTEIAVGSSGLRNLRGVYRPSVLLPRKFPN